MADGVVTIAAAVIAAGAAVTVAYASNFVAEQYRRHLDSTGWASALAGELKSHAEAFPMLKGLFADLLKRVEQKEPLPLYTTQCPWTRCSTALRERSVSLARSSQERLRSHTKTCERFGAPFSWSSSTIRKWTLRSSRCGFNVCSR